jgi:hypothetical protein
MTTVYDNQSIAFRDLSGNTATISPNVGFTIATPLKTLTADVDGFNNGTQTLSFMDLYGTVEKARAIKFDTSSATTLNVKDTIVVDNTLATLSTTITPSLITMADTINTNTLTATTWSGTSNKVELTTATGNTEFEVVVSQNPSGSNVLSGTTNLKYNPSTETLSVVNIIATGTEQQTGTLITNILKTNIILQRVLYFNTQTITLTTPTILTNGTFYISQYDSGSIVANSIITVNLPSLPTDGSLDGFSFQFRKVRGGVNQSSPNWTFVAPAFIIIPFNRTFNAGSGGIKMTDNINSFTNRIEIITIGGIGYYCFVES